jgi:hypothetical protein
MKCIWILDVTAVSVLGSNSCLNTYKLILSNMSVVANATFFHGPMQFRFALFMMMELF